MARFVGVSITAAVGTASLVSFFPASVRADVKVVSQVTISGVPTGGGPSGGAAGSTRPDTKQTVTTYYKGAKIRTETAEGSRGSTIAIYDTVADKVYLLNTAQKTYTVSSPKAGVAANPMMAMLEFKTTANVKPGGKTRTIAGKPAKNYVWTANMAISMKNGMNRPGMPPSAAPRTPSGPMMTIQMQGEQWTTEAVALPSSGSKMMASLLDGSGMGGGGGMGMTGMKPLLDSLSRIKGLPLSSKTTQTFGGMAAGMMSPSGGAARKPVVITSETVSLSEATLPATLFAPPADYKMIQKAAPMMGQPGGMNRRMPPPQ